MCDAQRTNPVVTFSALTVAFITVCSVLMFPGCQRDSSREFRSININGVTARFDITTAKVKRGKKLKVTGIYRNDSSQPVTFRVVPPIYDSQLWRGNTSKTTCMMVADMPKIDVFLKPGEEYRLPDELPLGSNCWERGRYSIRFYYDLTLLPPSRRQACERQYPVVDGAVAWEDRAHTFVVE